MPTARALRSADALARCAARRIAALLLSFAMCGCGSDGQTPDCPELPLYDIRVPMRREQQRAALEAAAERGCLTLALDDGQAGSGNN